MARKKKSSKKSQPVDLKIKHPQETKRSLGSFYIKKNSSGTWSLLLESYQEGKRTQETISKAIYYKFGLRPEMTVQQAREEIRKYNSLRKNENHDIRKQMNALKRADRMIGLRQDLFPPELVRKFEEKISELHSSPRYKVRMLGVFVLITEMISKEIKILPSQYADEIGKITNYFKKKQYSLSYCMDIIYMMNWWGKFYAKNTGTYFEKIEKLRANAKTSIAEAHKFKQEGVRTAALPIDETVLKRIKQNMDSKNEEHQRWVNWIECAYRFGLRPSEIDRVIGNAETTFEDGAEILLVEQTKTVFDNSDRDKIKRIPILCEEQEGCLEILRNGNAIRPHPKWIDKMAKDSQKKYNRFQKYDCYSPRKGATDYWLKDLKQTLENCALFLGHRSIDTTLRHYKDKNRVYFTPTEFISKNKKAS